MKKEVLERVIKVANLSIDDAQHDVIIDKIGSIIDWASKIEDIDTDNVDPTFNVNSLLGGHLEFREDKVVENDIPESILKNAKEVEFNHFSVNKVVEDH